MNKKRDLTSDEFDEDNYLNDYKSLIEKLQNISKSIDLLEKKFLQKKK
tara:strand:- start:195 stop:338 length:144 start_codon:yes stop_codon:yes gene_type:complete